uniref:Velvet domain-containing protein n=1 Tax=Bursaphelenchus xylophilus TaxID=6326 RepID=A0A1I7SKH2_BURXY
AKPPNPRIHRAPSADCPSRRPLHRSHDNNRNPTRCLVRNPTMRTGHVDFDFTRGFRSPHFVPAGGRPIGPFRIHVDVQDSGCGVVLVLRTTPNHIPEYFAEIRFDQLHKSLDSGGECK